MLSLFTLATLALIPLSGRPAAGSSGDGEGFLIWKGERHSLEELSSLLSERTLQELRTWGQWCREHGYQAVLDEQGRALLVTSAERNDLDKLVEKARQAGELVDAIAPLPQRDPDETFLVPQWGLGQHIPERDTAAVALVETQTELDSLLALLETLKPFLAGQLSARQTVPAFHSGEASTGALLSAPEDVEIGTVWRVHNEVVNRLARLLLHRRFGELPYWLEMGLAWHVEQSVMGDLYSFPGRNEFVSVHDHDGWKDDLKREFRKRRKEPLRLEEVTGWTSARWNGHSAALAWGLAKFLAEQPSEKVSAILEALRLDMKDNGVKVEPDGSWQVVVGYVTPVETQHRILAEQLGEDYLERVSNYFRTWKP